MKVLDSVVFGKFLLTKAYNMGSPLNMTQLQKLLFIIYGHYLAEKDFILVNESPKAWPYGPVFPRVRNEVKLNEIIEENNSIFETINNNSELIKVTEEVVEKYGKYSATKLSNWSHAPNSPWELTTKLQGFKWDMPIPNEFVKNYFLKYNI